MKIRKRSFTLIELLAILSIISVLSSLLFSALNTAHDMHEQIACVNKMREVGLAHVEYQVDNNAVVVPFKNVAPGRGFQDSWFFYLGPYVPEIFQERMIEGSYTGGRSWLEYEEYHVPRCPAYEMGTAFKKWGSADPVTVEHTSLLVGGIGMNVSFGNYGESAPYPRKLYKNVMIKKPTETALNLEAISWGVTPGDWDGGWYNALFPHPDGMNVLYFDGHIGKLEGDDPYTTSWRNLIWLPDGTE